MSSTATFRMTPLIRSQLRANLQMTPLRATQRSLSCQGHSASRFASTSASTVSSTIASAAAKIPERARADWGRLIKGRGKQALVYFSVYAGFLGWPIAAEKMIMWSRGV